MEVWLSKFKQKTSFQYATIIVAVVIVSQLGVHNVSLSKIAVSTYENLANVASMSAGVAPNEYSRLATEFDQKDRELTAREQMLILRERDLGLKYEEAIAANNKLTLYTLGGATLILLLLIFLNFYFDVKREESRERAEKSEKTDELTTHL